MSSSPAEVLFSSDKDFKDEVYEPEMSSSQDVNSGDAGLERGCVRASWGTAKSEIEANMDSEMPTLTAVEASTIRSVAPSVNPREVLECKLNEMYARAVEMYDGVDNTLGRVPMKPWDLDYRETSTSRGTLDPIRDVSSFVAHEDRDAHEVRDDYVHDDGDVEVIESTDESVAEYERRKAEREERRKKKKDEKMKIKLTEEAEKTAKGNVQEAIEPIGGSVSEAEGKERKAKKMREAEEAEKTAEDAGKVQEAIYSTEQVDAVVVRQKRRHSVAQEEPAEKKTRSSKVEKEEKKEKEAKEAAGEAKNRKAAHVRADMLAYSTGPPSSSAGQSLQQTAQDLEIQVLEDQLKEMEDVLKQMKEIASGVAPNKPSTPPEGAVSPSVTGGKDDAEKQQRKIDEESDIIDVTPRLSRLLRRQAALAPPSPDVFAISDGEDDVDALHQHDIKDAGILESFLEGIHDRDAQNIVLKQLKRVAAANELDQAVVARLCLRFFCVGWTADLFIRLVKEVIGYPADLGLHARVPYRENPPGFGNNMKNCGLSKLFTQMGYPWTHRDFVRSTITVPKCRRHLVDEKLVDIPCSSLDSDSMARLHEEYHRGDATISPLDVPGRLFRHPKSMNSRLNAASFILTTEGCNMCSGHLQSRARLMSIVLTIMNFVLVFVSPEVAKEVAVSRIGQKMNKK